MRKTLVFFGYLLLMAAICFSQTSYNTLDPIRIEFGETRDKLGTLGPGNDSWHPLFFAVLKDGSIAVPDYYKERIAVFSKKGEYLREIPASGLVSPRMNYFGASDTGIFVLFNDSALYALSETGEVLWNIPFPMGVFPESIHTGNDGAYFSVSDGGNARTFSINYEKPYEIIEAPFSFIWKTEAESLSGELEGEAPGFDAALFKNNSINSSWWYRSADNEIRIWAVSGNAGQSWSITAGELNGGSWKWPVLHTSGNEMVLYVLGTGEKAMTILRYSLLR